MIEMQHIDCGKIAFRYDHAPQVGEVMRARLAQKPDGGEIKTGAVMRCYGCGEMVHPSSKALKPVEL